MVFPGFAISLTKILFRFEQDIQIMKITTPLEEICYVSTLNRDSYVRPADVVFGSKVGPNGIEFCNLFQLASYFLNAHARMQRALINGRFK